MGFFNKLKDKNVKSEFSAQQDNIQIKGLDNCLKSMCILDIIIQPKEKKWLRTINCYVENNSYKYVIDNGAGDNLIVWFSETGVLIKGFDHESPLNQLAADEWNEKFFEYTFTDMPAQFIDLLTETDRDETTFCMWYLKNDNKWIQNSWADNDGGKSFLLRYIRRTAQEWKEWADYYYKKDFDFSAVQRIYDTCSTAEKDIQTLNPSRDINSVLEEIQNLL